MDGEAGDTSVSRPSDKAVTVVAVIGAPHLFGVLQVDAGNIRVLDDLQDELTAVVEARLGRVVRHHGYMGVVTVMADQPVDKAADAVADTIRWFEGRADDLRRELYVSAGLGCGEGDLLEECLSRFREAEAGAFRYRTGWVVSALGCLAVHPMVRRPLLRDEPRPDPA